MAFAYGTSITTPKGTASIEQLTQGDTVSAWTPEGAVPKAVIFSSGTPGGFPENGIFFLEFGEGSLIVTRDQPIVLAGNKVKKATQLRPGDQLLKADGQTVILDRLFLGQWSRGLHGITVDNHEKTGNHLIIANGIVCGDYLIEVTPTPHDDDSDNIPFLGTEEHRAID